MKIEAILGGVLKPHGFTRLRRYIYKQQGTIVVKLVVYSSYYSDDVYVDVMLTLTGSSASYKPTMTYDASIRLDKLLPETDPLIHAELSAPDSERLAAYIRQLVPTLEGLFSVETLNGLRANKLWVIAAAFPEKLRRLKLS